jgi:nitrite reductase/ring-hydroxylating ferredoxin subunit
MMRRRSLATLFAMMLTLAAYAPALAASDGAGDTDVRKVDAKVVEVNEQHISIVARTGVEHVIATDAADTHVTLRGKRVGLKKLRVGDVVTVDLDASSQMKFARRIVIGEQAGDTLASAKD